MQRDAHGSTEHVRVGIKGQLIFCGIISVSY